MVPYSSYLWEYPRVSERWNHNLIYSKMFIKLQLEAKTYIKI